MRVVVGMSGGVDSSVAALLAKREGHEVLGVFMNNWEEQEEDGACTARQDWEDVRRVCDILDIPCYSVDFSKQYREQVFSHFLEEYRRYRTPNPDVLCNREIKFDVFLRYALSLGAEKLVTGHFARLGESGGKTTLLRARDENKDQTYFLCMVGHEAFSSALFPVGGMTKAEIRELARKEHIPVSDKKDSTGVCFIGERDFRAFLKQYLPAQPGEITDVDGHPVGRHEGLMYYTLGQRRGLGIGGGGNGDRWFVVAKDVANNRLIVSQGEDRALLYRSEATADGACWVAGEPPAGELDCMVRLRHRQPLQQARIIVEGDRVRMRFSQPQRAVTPGQAAAFYLGDRCLGGATVE